MGELQRIDLITRRYDPLEEIFDYDVACQDCYAWVWSIEHASVNQFVFNEVARLKNRAFYRILKYEKYSDLMGDGTLDLGVDP
jgi:hypothetical protein